MPFASNVLTGGALAGMAASSWVGFSAGFTRRLTRYGSESVESRIRRPWARG